MLGSFASYMFFFKETKDTKFKPHVNQGRTTEPINKKKRPTIHSRFRGELKIKTVSIVLK